MRCSKLVYLYENVVEMNVWYVRTSFYDCSINCSGAEFRESNLYSTIVLAVRLMTDLALLFLVLFNNAPQFIAHLVFASMNIWMRIRFQSIFRCNVN